MTDLDHKAVQIAAAKLQMSHTLQLVANLAQDMPFDMQDKDDRKSALSTCLVDITRAMDEGKITFLCRDDRAVTLGLLAAVFVILHGGPVKLEKVIEQ